MVYLCIYLDTKRADRDEKSAQRALERVGTVRVDFSRIDFFLF